MDLLNLLHKGGLLIWPIIAGSIIGMTIYFERLLLYRKVYDRLYSTVAIQQTIHSISQGDLSTAKSQLEDSIEASSAEANILNEVIEWEFSDQETLELAVIHIVERETNNLAGTLPTLAVIASAEPLLGLLGTVIGMIKAFMVVEQLGGSVNAAVLAGGIWEAMITTAFGLLAAIPLLFFYNHLEGKLNRIQVRLEDIAIQAIKAWTKAQMKSPR